MEQLNEAAWVYKPGPEKWSKKEILGHLIDSAQNNIRRAIVAQYEEAPSITYQQDNWVTLAGYQERHTPDMIRLWSLLNLHFAAALARMSPAATALKVRMGSPEPVTLEWMASDYCNHLLHHLHQILDLDAIAYP